MNEVGINRISRREFMKNGLVFAAGAAGLAAGYAAVPDVFARAVYSAKDGVTNDKVLVMIQLAGGADGLQTVMPLQDSRLRAMRPRLSAAMDQALPLANTTLGINRNLRGIKGLYDQGKVAIVNGVGYPKPSLSHFDSIRVWETADPTRKQIDGWLGKTIAKNYDSQGHPLVGCACGTSEVPGALRDLEATLSVVSGENSFKFNGSDADRVMGAIYNGTPGIYGALFDQSVFTARDTVARLRTAHERYVPKAKYNDNPNLVYSSPQSSSSPVSARRSSTSPWVAGTRMTSSSTVTTSSWPTSIRRSRRSTTTSPRMEWPTASSSRPGPSSAGARRNRPAPAPTTGPHRACSSSGTA